MESSSHESPLKKVIAAALFAIIGVSLSYVVPTVEIAWVVGLLVLTIYLFVFEVVEVDVAAICVMVLLGLTTLFAPHMGLEAGLVDTTTLFQGFSSNAVISIIAVMIIGAGLDKTGVMGSVANFIMRIGGSTENRIIPIISGTVGVISSFMQNVGAAALFLPVISRISVRSEIPMSRLLMPMGFCAILGGTVTMIGSSPLILLNDLLITSNQSLPEEQQMALWSLFSVTPIGLALIAVGIVYFIVAGRFILPVRENSSSTNAASTMSYFKELYGIDSFLYEVYVPRTSPLVDTLFAEVEDTYDIRIVATKRPNTRIRIGPGALARDLEIEPGMVMGIFATRQSVEAFVEQYELKLRDAMQTFAETLSPAKAGIGELVVPPSSMAIGNTVKEMQLRKMHGVSLIALYRNNQAYIEGNEIRDMALQAGDTMVIHTPWESLAEMERNNDDFVVVTGNYPHEEFRPTKVGWAGLFFLISISMILFTDLRLSVALLTGALGMVLSGVLKIEEAYQAVSWKTVFLLASLIPLGIAVESTGTAKWIAEQTVLLVGDMPLWVIQTAIALLATFFTLVMSNVGATVLLVPLAINIALQVGADPAVYALTVAIATSNSFIIPTHQVNALIMGPGGYSVLDFMKAGGGMTILFLIVMMVTMTLLY